jgi:DNA-binding response OmpR family regulator
VVDDEDITRRSLADILILEGYKVWSAGSGDEAIALIQKYHFDLILLDLKMPGIDGLEVLRFVTRNDYDKQPESKYPLSSNKDSSGSTSIIRPTVILLTAHGSLESAIEALRNGAQDYLLKPASPEQIIKSVYHALEERAEALQKQTLLGQLETSIHKLNTAEKENLDKPKSHMVVLKNRTTFDLARREIQLNDLSVKLTPIEGKLLKVFLESPRQVFTHREIVLLVQGYDIKDWGAAEILRPVISRLRKKLILFPDGEKWIVSVRGTGYVFDIEL